MSALRKAGVPLAGLLMILLCRLAYRPLTTDRETARFSPPVKSIRLPTDDQDSVRSPKSPLAYLEKGPTDEEFSELKSFAAEAAALHIFPWEKKAVRSLPSPESHDNEVDLLLPTMPLTVQQAFLESLNQRIAARFGASKLSNWKSSIEHAIDSVAYCHPGPAILRIRLDQSSETGPKSKRYDEFSRDFLESEKLIILENGGYSRRLRTDADLVDYQESLKNWVLPRPHGGRLIAISGEFDDEFRSRYGHLIEIVGAKSTATQK